MASTVAIAEWKIGMKAATIIAVTVQSRTNPASSDSGFSGKTGVLLLGKGRRRYFGRAGPSKKGR